MSADPKDAASNSAPAPEERPAAAQPASMAERRGGRLALGLSVVVAGAALADLWVAARGSRAPVDPAVMARAAERLRSASAPGDVVVHSPLFTVSELAALGNLDARPDRPKAVLRSRRRVVALELAGYSMYGLGPAATEEDVGGGLVLRTFAPVGEASGALWSLVTDLQPTTMRVERGGTARSCEAARAEGGYRCPGEPDWLYAAPRVLRVDGRDRECVWAHPTTGGTIVLTVPPAPAPMPGHRLELRVQAGLTDDAARQTPDGATVTTAVVQGKPLGRVVVPNRVGWFKGAYPLAPDRAAELRITTPRDGRRHHCVMAQVYEVKQ